MFQLTQHRLSKRRQRPLSAQYLHYLTKLHDGLSPDEDGTSIEAALEVMKTYGSCLETDLEYQPRHDIRQIYTVRGHKPEHTEAKLMTLAKVNRIAAYRLIGHSVPEIKAELVQKRPVGIGVAVYELAWYNSMARARGEIALPPMDKSGPQAKILDTYLGGHAISLVGYCDNTMEPNPESHRPGGGYFIFRNSWGEDWGVNDHGRGYGCLPYEYVERFCLEAAVIEDLRRTEKRAQPAARAHSAQKRKIGKSR